MTERNVNKRLIRWIKEQTLAFGPKRKGPNILLNRLMKREDSFFFKLNELIPIDNFYFVGQSTNNENRDMRKTR